ncbi:hypothetical protein E0K89_010510 [Aquicoccus sp. SCR17]|nr:hypothetical protein [Carideicomes alvinocaridis]
MLRTRQQAGPELSRVTYNPATQAFEAVVTFHNSDGRMTYAASLAAPLDMSFEEAAEGLIRDARAQARKANALGSRFRSRGSLIEMLTGRRAGQIRSQLGGGRHAA